MLPPSVVPSGFGPDLFDHLRSKLRVVPDVSSALPSSPGIVTSAFYLGLLSLAEKSLELSEAEAGVSAAKAEAERLVSAAEHRVASLSRDLSADGAIVSRVRRFLSTREDGCDLENALSRLSAGSVASDPSDPSASGAVAWLNTQVECEKAYHAMATNVDSVLSALGVSVPAPSPVAGTTTPSGVSKRPVSGSNRSTAAAAKNIVPTVPFTCGPSIASSISGLAPAVRKTFGEVRLSRCACKGKVPVDKSNPSISPDPLPCSKCGNLGFSLDVDQLAVVVHSDGASAFCRPVTHHSNSCEDHNGPRIFGPSTSQPKNRCYFDDVYQSLPESSRPEVYRVWARCSGGDLASPAIVLVPAEVIFSEEDALSALSGLDLDASSRPSSSSDPPPTPKKYAEIGVLVKSGVVKKKKTPTFPEKWSGFFCQKLFGSFGGVSFVMVGTSGFPSDATEDSVRLENIKSRLLLDEKLRKGSGGSLGLVVRHLHGKLSFSGSPDVQKILAGWKAKFDACKKTDENIHPDIERFVTEYLRLMPSSDVAAAYSALGDYETCKSFFPKDRRLRSCNFGTGGSGNEEDGNETDHEPAAPVVDDAAAVSPPPSSPASGAFEGMLNDTLNEIVNGASLEPVEPVEPAVEAPQAQDEDDITIDSDMLVGANWEESPKNTPKKRLRLRVKAPKPSSAEEDDAPVPKKRLLRRRQ